MLDLQDDPDFANQFDKTLWPTLTARLETIFASRTREAWQAEFANSDSCVAPVLTPEQAHAHQMNDARKIWHAQNGVFQAAPAPRFSQAPEWTPVPVAERGAHTQDILDELGLSSGATPTDSHK